MPLKSSYQERLDFTPDGSEWANRSEFWNSYRPTKPGRNKKYRFREPLILCGHSAGVRVDHDTLLIRNGFTHYPQKEEKFRFFPGDPNLPDRIIILDASGGISFDALSWMTDQKINLVQLDWRGRVNFSGNSGFAANPKFVQWQSEIRNTEESRKINRWLIAKKFEASIDTLSAIFGKDASAKLAIKKIRDLKLKILDPKTGNSHSKILGYEGAAAAIYYYCWHGLPLKWTKLSKRPIPRSWHEVGSRRMVWRKDSNQARHPINAMLNYGYGVLISQLHADIVAAGFDPTIGLAHFRTNNPIPLACDLMEPLRPVVDREVLTFAMTHTFEPGDFSINRIGGCRLNPQMAKSLVSQLSRIDCRDYVHGLVAAAGGRRKARH
jgi:CRISPR-associated endonuclease Cas1